MANQHIQQPFLCAAPQSEDWVLFKKQFTNYLTIVDATEEKKLPILLNCIGRDGYTIYDGLADPKTAYNDAIARFDDFFKTRSSLLLRRKQFFEAKQGPHESMVEYSCRLRRLIAQCDFDAATSTMLLRDIFVCGIYSNLLGERLLSEDASTLTFNSAITRAEAWERAKSDRQTVGNTNAYNAVRNVTKTQTNDRTNSGKKCFRCNSTQHLANNVSCPGRAATCHQCGRKGHFKVACRSSGAATDKQQTESRRLRVSALCSNAAGLNCASSDPDNFTVYTSVSSDETNMRRTVYINEQQVEVLIDTGAEVNILPASTVSDINIQPTSVTVSAWGNFPLQVIGETICSVTYKNMSVRAKFIIVKGVATNNLPLFSTSLCRQLHMLHELLSATQLDKPIHDTNAIVSEFEERGIFSGLGLVKNFACKVEVDETIKPVASPPVKLPPAILDQVEAQLQELCKDNVIRKVEEPTSWCSRLVIAKKKSGEIRICTDLRAVNVALKRPVFPMPEPADIFARIGKAKVYSLLDCRSAFHQLALEPASQKYFTFAAPSGRYVWQRMPMGAKIAPEVFQKVLSDLLADISNVYVFYDDILIAAEDAVAHSTILARVLGILSNNGLTLNKEKCIFGVEKLDFLGHSLSPSGVAPSESKIEAIMNMPEPKTKEQLRSFLGLANYVGQKFVPNFASLSAPLWKLCSKDISFNWTTEVRKCFITLRQSIGQAAGTVWFDLKKDIVIQTDASMDGVGCVLLQDNQPVAYASRKLTPCEKRYSVIEKEFLGIVFALKKFRRLLLFNKCQLFTDHKPIIGLLEKRLDSLPIRIQKWVVQIQAFDIHFHYIEGDRNVLADALSRNSLEKVDNSPSDDLELDDAEYTICFILQKVPVDIKMVANATQSDCMLQQVKEAIVNSWNRPQDRKLVPFYGMREQLSIKRCSSDEQSDVILKGDLLVIPDSLVENLLLQLHDGHIGGSKMKSLLQSFAYWPGFSKDVDSFVKRCQACTVYQNKADKAPLKSVASEVKVAYHTLAIDLTGPNDDALKGHTLLTIIDMFSRYPEVYVLKRSTSAEIINCLGHSFARFGLPVKIITDNGPQFTSAEFDEYLEQRGICHSKSSNYFPSSNGCIERFHGTLKNRLKKVFYDHREIAFETALDKVLYDIRKTTNAMTGQTPYQLLFGRPMRTELSRLTINDRKHIKSSARDIEREYFKASSRVIPYRAGDRVFYRLGAMKPFSGSGTIIRDIGNNAFEVATDRGYSRIYNQSNLKFRFHDKDTSAAESAYDAVAEREHSPAAKQHFVQKHRYNLRSKPVDPACYKS